MTAPQQSTEVEVRKGIHSSIVGIIVNLALAFAKCLAGIMGHSFALVADGIESFSDVLSSSVVAVGLWLAIKPPDEDHPYGHGKFESLAAIIVSLALVGAGTAIAAQSIAEIRTPHRLPQPYTLAVLLGVVVIKIILSRYVGSAGEHIESTAVKADAWHHLSDAVTSALAFFGITIALLTTSPTADDWVALCASPIILFNGIRQMRAPLRELLDTSPSAKLAFEVRQTAERVANVAEVEECYARKVGVSLFRRSSCVGGRQVVCYLRPRNRIPRQRLDSSY
jgi:cation diffusion facilitator family transporter